MSQEGSNAIREDNGPSGATPPSPDPFQPKKQSKLIRMLTVIAYMLSVSMAAIFLSAYYIFMYDAQPTLAQKTYPAANALTQGPNFHQYEQYVYIKEKKILKDKGLLTSNLIQNVENNTDESESDNQNSTYSLIDNKINVDNKLFETEMRNNSYNNNVRFSFYRLYKRNMEKHKENEGGKMKNKQFLVAYNQTEDRNIANETVKTEDSSDGQHVPTEITQKKINSKIPFTVSENNSNITESNFDYENNSTDVNIEQLLLNISDTINKEY